MTPVTEPEQADVTPCQYRLRRALMRRQVASSHPLPPLFAAFRAIS